MVRTGTAVLCPCHCCLSPLNPLQGALRISSTPEGPRLCHSCRSLGRLSTPLSSFSQPGTSPTIVAQDFSACICLFADFPLSFETSQCTAAGLLRQDPAARRAPAGYLVLLKKLIAPAPLKDIALPR